MSKQPNIYTHPEAFIEDKSVPMRWKLYALINGFWIGGVEVFASNKFFAEKLKCTERHIQGCLEDLERLGVVRRNIKGLERYIVPGTNPAFVGGRTGSSQRDEPSVRHNSDSISDSINTANADSIQVIQEDAKPPKPRKDTENEKIARWWYRKCHEYFDRQPVAPLTKAMRIVGDARKKLTNSQLREMMENHIEDSSLEEADRMQITQALSNYKIDKYLANV